VAQWLLPPLTSPQKSIDGARGRRQTPAMRLPRALIAGLLAAAGCHAAGTPSPALDRGVLLRPDDPFWETPAPSTYRAGFEMSKGSFVVEVYRAWAPLGADRFYNLVRAGFFDDSRFFRVVPDFIAQFGIPGDPAITRIWQDRTFPDDPPRENNVRGTLAFAMKGPNDRRTQVYINLRDNARNDGQGFAIIGRVVEGMGVVDSLYAGYGETSGGGMRAGRQRRVLEEGNAYLDSTFPKLDRIVRATILR